MKPFPTSAAEAEAVHGRTLLLHSLMNEQENESPETTENVQHSAQSRTAPSTNQPGRNTPCPCKSGLKYKRCCLNRSDLPRVRDIGVEAKRLGGFPNNPRSGD
jgi:hypothetical protein